MSKGSRRERKCVSLWKRAGFATYRPATVRYGENDMFGLFDVLAISPSHNHVHGIQVKSNKATGINGWKRHTRLFRALGWKTFYAVPVDNQGWIIYDCGKEPADARRSAAVVVDERDTSNSIGDGVVSYLRSLQGE